MIKFKNLLLVLSMLFATSFYGQTVLYKTTSLSMSVKGERNGKWTPYTDAKPVAILAKIDLDKNRILIHSDIEQLYQIGTYYPVVEKEDCYINTFKCLSLEGDTVDVVIISDKKGNHHEMYLKEFNRVLLYSMQKMTDKK